MLLNDQILDVREMDCETRCPLVQQTYASLSPGEAFVLVHTFEPVPLKIKLEALSEYGVGWERLETGPEMCKVRISKTLEG